jgi:uncharacterized protein
MGGSAWLLREGEVLASLEVASTFRRRLRGLLGRSDFEGALLLAGARSVHTLGMRFAVDVAHLDAELVVVRTTTMRPWRVGRYVPRARNVVEAPAGAFASWGLRAGDQLEVKGLG